MTFKEKIEAFAKLGMFLEQFGTPGKTTEPGLPWLEELNRQFFRPLEQIILNGHIHNPWFTEDNLRFALTTTGRTLNVPDLVSWLSCYNEPVPGKSTKKVAVVMAGNVPLAGFHDMLCVLMADHNILAKLSAKDDRLLKMFAAVLYSINNSFEGRIEFTEGRLKEFDAVIATGSDNTARYFEFYFGKYPNIIRKNRNSAAIIDGSETRDELKLLADDVFTYFGLGCRSVSKLFIPEGYDFTPMLEEFSAYRHLINHNQWANNYDYQKAIHLIDSRQHLDTGFLLLREEASCSSPIAVLNYEKTGSTKAALESAGKDREKLQCIVGSEKHDKGMIPFGEAQRPGLSDYADDIDTMEFLLDRI